MTTEQLSAFRAGLRHAADQARIAALALEIRPDAHDMRQRAAIEALLGLADGLRSPMADTTNAADRCIFVVVYNEPEAAPGYEAGP